MEWVEFKNISTAQLLKGADNQQLNVKAVKGVNEKIVDVFGENKDTYVGVQLDERILIAGKHSPFPACCGANIFSGIYTERDAPLTEDEETVIRNWLNLIFNYIPTCFAIVIKEHYGDFSRESAHGTAICTIYDLFLEIGASAAEWTNPAHESVLVLVALKLVNDRTLLHDDHEEDEYF